MPRMLHHDRMVKLFIKAMHSGGVRKSISHIEWNIAGRCTAPYWQDVIGRPEANVRTSPHVSRNDRFEWHPGKKSTLRVSLGTPCRKCDKCRKARSAQWRYRIVDELRRAGRSWFVTLTLSPIWQYRVLSEARHEAHTRGVRWEADLTDEQRFSRVANASLKHVTRYVKRIRKQSGVPLRYICVTERHKTGLPHFHLLIHEVELKPVTHSVLARNWNGVVPATKHSPAIRYDYGFEKIKLVDLDRDPKLSARYICKYLTKDATTRIRASQLYGQSIDARGIVLTSWKDTT